MTRSEMNPEALANKLRALAKSGDLNYISLAFGSGEFRAVYCPARKFGLSMATHADPVEAILLALSRSPKVEAPKVEAPKAAKATRKRKISDDELPDPTA
jgi:hypothetical protein